MRDLFRLVPEDARRGLRRRSQPVWLDPMLATLSREPFSDPDWLFEAKLDGIRCLVFRKGREVHLYSRNRLGLNSSFPTLVAPLLEQQQTDFIADGEIVVIFEKHAETVGKDSSRNGQVASMSINVREIG